ncbi:MAG: glucosaminidase domain-containing protein [Bacteroidales bacterium]|jgi:LysM repeat protein|nr:glucosaminidase domain-containing protein [Bacteroidales bacterium]MCI1785063.1 glucosaminidase domain-containing protein [Bacteroidales bacterium]
MKKFYRVSAFFIFFTVFAFIAVSNPEKTPEEKYIAKYSGIAVSEMYRSGIPASITLAQGLLESRSGRAPLAVRGNNHFGIKCHDWTGSKMYQDDDSKGECFRVYGNAEESFRDHSDFLRYRDRYKFLFDNKITDYKAWAYGLKQAGYATDPAYPSKLIKLIETYHLYEFDTMTMDDALAMEGTKEKTPVAGTTKRRWRIFGKKKNKTGSSSSAGGSHSEKIPESPLSIEEPIVLDPDSREVFKFSLSRQLYSLNGVPFVYSIEGDTYSSLASLYHLFVPELLRFNDLKTEADLLPGTVVYLQPKKSQAAKDMDKYIVGVEGESLRDICQRFAVRMNSVMKMNGFSSGYSLREGDTVILRGKSLRRGIFKSRKKNVSHD